MTTPRNARAPKSSFETLLNLGRPERTELIPQDYEAAQAVPVAERELESAREQLRIFGDEPERRAAVAKAEGELKTARDRVRASAVKLRFRALSRVDFEALMAAHPPGEEDEAKRLVFGAGFAPALIAASLVEPQLSVAEAAQVYEQWAPWQARVLFNTAFDLNVQRPLIDLGKG